MTAVVTEMPRRDDAKERAANYRANSRKLIMSEEHVRRLHALMLSAERLSDVLEEYDDPNGELRALAGVIEMAGTEARALSDVYRG